MNKDKMNYLDYRKDYPEEVQEHHKGRIDRIKTGGLHNSYAACATAARLSMLRSHTQDELPLLNPTTNQSLTGNEIDKAESSWHNEIEDDGVFRILRVLDRQEPNEELCLYSPGRLVIYENIETGEVSCATVERFMQHHPTFGFPLRETPELEELTEGDVVGGGLVLTKSTAWGEDGSHRFGRDANIAMYSLFGTNEDGAIANRDTIQRDFVGVRYSTIELHIDNSNYLLPIHAGRVLPVIGQVIKYKGLVAATRRRVKENNLIHRLRKKSKRVRNSFDTPYYSEKDCEVINVEVYRKHEKPKTNYCPLSHNDFLDRLWNHNLNFYREILKLDTLLRINRGSGYAMTPDWHIMVTEAERCATPRVGNKPEPDPTRGDKADVGYYIKITTKSLVIPQIGHKFTGNQGEKVVICEMRSNEAMLKDKWGRVADFIVNPNGILNRNIPAMAFEPYGNDVMFHLKRRMQKIEDKEERAKYYLEGLSVISDRSYHFITNLPPEDFQAHLDTVCADGYNEKLYRCDEVGDLSVSAIGVNKIIQSKFKPPRAQCTFITNEGNPEFTRCNVRIGAKRLFAINKIGEYSSACAIPERQITGFAKRLKKNDKKHTQISEQANRDVGPAEARNFFASLPADAVIRSYKVGLSPSVIRRGLQQILDGAITTNVDIANNKSRGAELLEAEFASYGFSLSNEPETADDLFDGTN